jgi:hypothetical protein
VTEVSKNLPKALRMPGNVFHRPTGQFWRKCVNTRCEVIYCCVINQFLELFEVYYLSVTDCRKLRSISISMTYILYFMKSVLWFLCSLKDVHKNIIFTNSCMVCIFQRNLNNKNSKRESKAIPVTGRGGL